MADTTVTVVGNLTDDPDLRFTPAGIAVVNFGLAVNRRKKDGDKWVDDDPHFFSVTAWRDLASNITESVEKGNRVVVTGQLSYETWEGKEGDKRSRVKIVADEVGPSLRWATAEVTKTQRSSESVASRNAETVKQEFSAEPF